MKPNPSRFFIPAVLLLCVLSSAPLRAQSPPAAYDLRAVVSGLNTEAWVPAVQDQGSAEDCWTFAAATAMNSNLLLTGTLPSVSTPPPIQISSWHLSTTNGSPDQLLAAEAFSNNNSNWGGFEYQTLGYVTRGSGSWQIPNVPAVNPGNYVQTMGGGPVLESSNPLNPFPQTISQMSGYPANLSSLIPPASQPAAYQVTSMVFYDQGYSSNVALPTPAGTVTISGTTYDTYSYTQGAADPQVAAVKSGIAQFGAVTTSMNADFNDFHFVAGSGPAPYTVEYFNNQTATGYSDHEVTIIGWDDNYSMTDPGTNITYTGAWLVQNSWGTNYWTGTDRQNDGTFWAPYNDAVIGRSGISSYQLRSNAGFSQTVIQNERGPMDYAGNFSAIGGTSPAWIGSPTGMASRQENVVASVLTPQSDGLLTALGVATQVSNASLQLQIFADWNSGPANLLSTQTFLLDGIGYHVLDLASAISLTALDSFVVELTYLDATTLQALQDAVPIVIGDGGLAGDYLHVPHNLSFYYTGSAWTDLADEIFSSYSGGSSDSHGGVLFLKGITAIPEPSTIACVLAGGILLAVWRRSSKAPQSSASIH